MASDCEGYDTSEYVLDLDEATPLPEVHTTL